MSTTAEDENMTIIPVKEACVYSKCYCEENVWKLCDYIRVERPDHLDTSYTVFISNSNKQVPIWQQTASNGPRLPVVWDYHVVLVRDCPGGNGKNDPVYVYDLDTRLPFPCEFHEYLAKAIRPDEVLKADYHRLFRVVPASVYLETFASDRSHMLKDDQTWMASPPPYPCIHTPESHNNLQDFISMDTAVGVGDILTTCELADRFGSADVMISKYLQYSAEEEALNSDGNERAEEEASSGACGPSTHSGYS